MEKKKIFSSLVDYNNLLEKVLENKNFSAQVKNILLSMIYKVEMAYPDYKKIKRKVKNKDEFLADLIHKIEQYCDYIQPIQPHSEEAKRLEEHDVLDLVNLNERSICAYPTEMALFSAISDIYPKYYYIDKKNEMRNLIQKMLVVGKHESDMEILRNFNGWSWNNTAPKKENIIETLLYHNLLYLVGDTFLTLWEKEKKMINYIEKLRNGLKRLYGERLANDIYVHLCRVLISNSDQQTKDHFAKRYETKVKRLEKLKDETLLYEIKEKSEHMEELKENFFEAQETSVSKKDDTAISQASEEEKEEKTLQEDTTSKENEEEMHQKKLREMIKELEEECLIFSAALQNQLEKDLEKLQIYFLKAYVQKIKKVKSQEAIVALIFEIRYYRNLYLSPKKILNENKKLKGQIDILSKILITKACKLGAITIFSNEIQVNYEMINYALDSKIVELDEIKMAINTKQHENVIVRVFDKETFEKEKALESPMKISDIRVKKNKAVKLFL